MAEESQGQEKTEEATQRKKNKAREEGQVARSRELSTMVLVIMGALGLMAVVPWGADRIMALTQRIIQMASIPDDNFTDVLGLATTETLLVIVPLLAIMFA
ncbi:MAG: EscU/YscU/HrcU family type III secretion system export apparatus switch protein, partial [Gammaproteobacteria bacterium]|nr:EscU/YscU/HrcU family type III secretion system export apparatus switch protein [Gammaproteobacteria bacterium]